MYVISLLFLIVYCWFVPSSRLVSRGLVNNLLAPVILKKFRASNNLRFG